MAIPAIHRVAVIGAGASGVLSAAHLKKEGVDVTVFERAPVAGGIWVWNPKVPLEPTYPSAKASVAEYAFHGNPQNVDSYMLHSAPGPCYESLKNNVPTPLLEMSLNPWKPDTEPHVNHRILKEYIQDTADKTGVTDITLFDTKVEHIEKDQGVWKVQTQTWDYATGSTTSKEWTFDAVVVASGHYHSPKTPNIPGLAEWKQAWPAKVQHSKSYRNNQGYEDQTVLLIGGSASSTDIAVELGKVAKKVWQSTRNGAFDHAPHMLPEIATRVAEIASFNLSPGDRSDGPGPIPGTVTLLDGQVLENIDRVIVATGYQFSLPFAPQYHRDDMRPQDADGEVLVTDGLQVHNLHKDIFYIPDPTLAFVGVPFNSATFSLFEFQAIAVAALYSGKATLPSEEEMRAHYKYRVQVKGFGKRFHTLWELDVKYAASLMEWVNQGREPSERKPDGYSAEWLDQKEKLRGLVDPKNILYNLADLKTPEVA